VEPGCPARGAYDNPGFLECPYPPRIFFAAPRGVEEEVHPPCRRRRPPRPSNSVPTFRFALKHHLRKKGEDMRNPNHRKPSMTSLRNHCSHSSSPRLAGRSARHPQTEPCPALRMHPGPAKSFCFSHPHPGISSARCSSESD